jgi:hypothetical protein
MNKNEVLLNRQDLGRYLEGENQIVSMIPGINSLTTKDSKDFLKHSISKSHQSINSISKSGSLLNPNNKET